MQATCDKLGRTEGSATRTCRLDDQLEGLEHRVAARASSSATCSTWPQAMAHSALNARSRAARTSGWTASSSATTPTSSSTRWPTTPATARRASSYGAVKITNSQPGTRAYGAAGEQADAERKAEGGSPWLIPTRSSRSRSCATGPSRTTEPVLAELQGAVHRRHVGAAGPAVHQGRPRRHAELSLVVPHGDLRQLRHDDRRQAEAVVPDLPARL